MKKRAVYLSMCAVLALTAAVITLRAQHTSTVLVATHDVGAGGRLQASDVETRHMSGDGVPPGALLSPDGAVGRYVAWPLTAGEPILSRELRAQRSQGAEQVGYALPGGYRAVAVPVLPAGAVGGMLVAGDRVDVYATPLLGHQQSSGAAPGTPAADGTTPGGSPAATLIGADVLVVQLRSDQGQMLDQSTSQPGSADVHGLTFGSTKLGSVVLAVPSDQVDRYASASGSMSIYLALDVS